ncbi:GapR family DNA-binding domain-containing protein [Bosea sp. (in: a-proteobacteria)]|uniref:GapR family DNA-binding domain-containing protein n=1 Tax=Bosea sp. (in: a-proteobacteria) TaxID=1871050 RepID=UPI00262203E8|nr:GapR family DNA-binding domain-containing protein [Bosea sp. (in: a-proteobacteria)]MCO5092034.1 DUF2312 domain-containing protein [Bosea sp. (in: a-proteobacteria)]
MSDGLLVQTMQRIMSVLDDIDERKADIKEIYREANGHGFDKAAIGVAIREIRGRAKADTPKAQERAAIVDLYVSTFDNAPRTYVHVPAREGRGQNPSREHAPVTQEEAHVDRGASAQPHSAQGEPAIPSKAGNAVTGQAVQEPETGIGQPSGAGTGSAVRAGAPVSNTSLGPLTAAQSEGAAGANPEEAAPASATESEVVTAQAQGAEFVTLTGEGEGGSAPTDPSPVADEPIKGLAAANAIAARAVQPSAPKTERGEIDIEIPAFLRRTGGGNHPSFGEQA